MARTRRTQAPPLRLILDSGAVIALSRNDARARAALAAAYEVGASVSSGSFSAWSISIAAQAVSARRSWWPRRFAAHRETRLSIG